MEMLTTLFWIGSSSNLQVTRIDIRSRTSLNSGHICMFTLELPALEHIFLGAKLLKKAFWTCWLSDERSLPIGLLVYFFSHYGNDPTFSDRQVWANNVHPDQTAPRGAV